MPISLTGKPIAITGASSGIGRVTALACARAGMPVVVSARRTHLLEKLVEEIRAAGGRAVAVEVDVRDPGDCVRLIETTVKEFGSIYAVFANAGYGAEACIHEMTAEEMRDIWETNFFGTLNAIRPAIAEMMQQPRGEHGAPRGHVLICTSCVARFTLPRLGAYTATKAAQAHIGTAMRGELRGHGLYVSTVHPIGTRTEFSDHLRRKGVNLENAHHTPAMFVQPAEAVSSRIVDCLRRPRPEVWTGPKGWLTRFAASLFTLSPRLGDLVGRIHTRD